MSDGTKNEFWRSHLADANNPLFHFVPQDLLDLAALVKASRELDFALFVIDARQIHSVSTLIDAIAQAVGFPDYFGSNWDALFDSMTDLSWKKASGYVLTLSDGESLLPFVNNGFSVLLGVLEATVRDWRDERGEYGERAGPIPFQVIFSGSDFVRGTLLRELKEPLCDHKAESDVLIFRTPGGVTETESFRDAKKLLQTRADLELILSFLRERGVCKLDAIYMLAALMDKNVPEAKSLAEKSKVWFADEHEADMRGRRAASDALRDLGLDDIDDM